MKTPRKLILKKERIRVLGSDSLRAAVGGDDWDGPYDDGAGNLPNNFDMNWWRMMDNTVDYRLDDGGGLSGGFMSLDCSLGCWEI
ncbi:MAG TPA: hypothetical protein VKN99_02395 [Polyangia bacterium]|nr:hypothetical protein [Polyangia bacterium]